MLTRGFPITEPETIMKRSKSKVRKILKPIEQPKRLLSTLTGEERKTFPMARGLLDYFPDALALVANVSYRGNEKHKPGEEMHHSRSKSSDHVDCAIRHLVERGSVDGDNIMHTAEAAWRVLAALQIEAEAKFGLSLARGATAE